MSADVRVVLQGGPHDGRDVTEGVKALYDLVTASLEWGSGFLSVEDAAGGVQ